MKRTPYRIEFTPEADDHFSNLEAHDRSALVDAIERQLVHQRALATRNRAPMEPNPIAQHRLRVGEMRVLYEVPEGAHPRQGQIPTYSTP